MPFFNNPVLRVPFPRWRGRLVLILLGLSFLALAVRALYLQGITTEFLVQQGERRYERRRMLMRLVSQLSLRRSKMSSGDNEGDFE